MSKLTARKAALCFAGYVLVIAPVLMLILLGANFYLGNRQLGDDPEQAVFMLALAGGFLVLVFLLIGLGVSLRTEANHANEQWPPNITR